MKILSLLFVILLSGCIDGKTYGAGELWLFEKGTARCINVVAYTSNIDRTYDWTDEYGDSDYNAALHNYYEGSGCKVSVDMEMSIRTVQNKNMVHEDGM
jgi:hypothetical protein